MIIQALVENTTINKDLQGEHGLSLHIKTSQRNILFDFGAGRLFAENAALLGIDLDQIDLAVLSHGHYDHGGGLPVFLERNTTAPVYLQESAFDAYFSQKPSGCILIGLDPSLREHPRIIPVHRNLQIDEKLFLFSDVHGRELLPESNRTLLIQRENAYFPDAFRHEQNLVITEKGSHVLFAGCAHCGIVNILDEYEQLIGGFPDLVVGGFHLMNPRTGKSVDAAFLTALAQKLMQTPTVYYTCHCTGLDAYQILKEQMGDQIQYLSTGTIINWPHI